MIKIETEDGVVEVELKPGDVFATRNPMRLGRIINFIQKIWSKDNRSKYSHAGLIVDGMGTTFEALWKIEHGDLYKYRGQEIIVARCVGVSRDQIQDGLIKSFECKGEGYPFWRLLLHLVPPLAKLSITKIPVCGEHVARYEWYLGVRHEQWAGTNPDTLADEWEMWRAFEVLGEGRLL